MFFAMSSGILMGWTMLIIMYRINLKKFLGYPAFMDAACTLILFFLLEGTLGGTITAISGGLFISLMITVLRKYYGYQRFSVLRRQWVATPGVFTSMNAGALAGSVTRRFWPVMILFAGMGIMAFSH